MNNQSVCGNHIDRPLNLRQRKIIAQLRRAQIGVEWDIRSPTTQVIGQTAAAGTEQSDTLRPNTHGDTKRLCSFCKMGIDLLRLERPPGHRADEKREP